MSVAARFDAIGCNFSVLCLVAAVFPCVLTSCAIQLLSVDGSFSIHLADGESRDFYAVYPAESADASAFGDSDLRINLPSAYSISKNGMADYSPLPMVAINDPSSEDVLFHHLGGILRLVLDEVPYETMKISVNVGKKVTGSFDVIDPSTSSPYIALSAGTAEDVDFNLTTPVSGTANDFVINLPLPVGEYETLSVKIYDRYGNLIVEKTQELVVSVERADGYEIPSDLTLDVSRIPVCFKMERDGEIRVKAAQTNPRTMEYSFDNVNWESFSSDRTFPLHRGETIYFHGANNSYSDGNSESESTSFSATSKCYLYGNIMSLINPDPDVFSTLDALPADYTFCFLFSHDNDWGDFSASICNHPTYDLLLPATDLTEYCYYYMFQNTGISRMNLPATEMKRYCYSYMFRGCNKMTDGVALPAMSLANGCYAGMFASCWLIKSAPALPATELEDYCYDYMFGDCNSLVNAPELPAMELKQGCYQSMFSYCISMKEAPELPATTLAYSCYSSMFNHCEKMTVAPAELPATTLTDHCYSSMFRGCEKLTTAPVLPATTLQWGCYSYMFEGCLSLNYLKAMFTEFPTDYGDNYYCVQDWLKDVPSSGGTYVKNSTATYDPTTIGVPSNWTVENASE